MVLNLICLLLNFFRKASQVRNFFRQILIAPEPYHPVVIYVELSFLIQFVYGFDLFVAFNEAVTDCSYPAVAQEAEKKGSRISGVKSIRGCQPIYSHIASIKCMWTNSLPPTGGFAVLVANEHFQSRDRIGSILW